MKNTIIFIVMLIAFVSSAIIAAEGPSESYVNVALEDGVSIKCYVYLTTERKRKRVVLDSCYVSGNRFSLTGKVGRKGERCRLEFAGSEYKPEFRLMPKCSLNINMIQDPYLNTIFANLRFAQLDSLLDIGTGNARKNY